MGEAVQLSLRTARRFVLGKQGLWPGRRWAGEAGTREAMRAAEYVQLDPLAILARSHDLVLHSRVSGYEPGFFDRVTYEERSFFEWGGWLAVRPMDELPYWRVVMRRERNHAGIAGVLSEHTVEGDVVRAAVDVVRAAIRERGTVTNADFAAAGPAMDHYRGGKPTSVALYYLWRVGEVMTHHRERFQRVYAPAEAVAPPELLAEAPEADADAFLVRKSVAFAGIGRPGRIGMPTRRLLARPVARHEETALLQTLVDQRALVPVEVESWRGAYFVLGEDLPLLEAIDRGQAPADWLPLDAAARPQVSLLSPLDPVSARGRAKPLFGFDYLWEIYLPAEKVQFGRYTLPILWGDALVGRVDLKIDRQANTLVANGLWFEDPATAKNADFADAFRTEIARLAAFLGTKRIDASAIPARLRPLFKATKR